MASLLIASLPSDDDHVESASPGTFGIRNDFLWLPAPHHLGNSTLSAFCLLIYVDMLWLLLPELALLLVLLTGVVFGIGSWLWLEFDCQGPSARLNGQVVGWLVPKNKRKEGKGRRASGET